jgi:hypothetical protein
MAAESREKWNNFFENEQKPVCHVASVLQRGRSIIRVKKKNRLGIKNREDKEKMKKKRLSRWKSILAVTMN